MQNFRESGFSEDIEFIGRIKMQYDSFSKKQKRIANYILSHQDTVIHYSITQMAQKTGTVPSTITRFCQVLSYKGFSELKVYMEKNLASPFAVNMPVQKEDTIPIMIQKMMNTFQSAVSDTMRTIDPKMVSQVVDEILHAKSVVFFGQSGGSISASYACQLFLRAGILSRAFTGEVDMNLAAGALGKGDVAIGIAYSGEVRSVIDAMILARKNKATVIAITAVPNSAMGKAAHLNLLYSYNIPDDLQYLYLASLCELAVIGILQTEIMRRNMQFEKIETCKKAVLSSRRK